jgi:hypothetical protein
MEKVRCGKKGKGRNVKGFLAFWLESLSRCCLITE